VYANSFSRTLFASALTLSFEAGRDMALGERVLRMTASLGCARDPRVVALGIDMYGACGNVAAARALFESVPAVERNIQMFTAMVSAYGTAGDSVGVASVLHERESRGAAPDIPFVVAVLKAAKG
jgi:pentatricopeptide repeat protein